MADAPLQPNLGVLPPAAWSAVDAGALSGRTLFVTGATGFVGGWLLAGIAHLNTTLATPLYVRALAREPQQYAADWLTWVSGDVRGFRDDASAELILHAGLPSTSTPAGGDAALRETAVRGAEAVVAHARACGARRLVVLSSGAVYGAMTTPATESSVPAPLAPGDTYAIAKREVESIVTEAGDGAYDAVIARLFTCIGAGYRNHAHLAHVSLLADARAGRPLVLRSDGSAVRSYLYGADLAVWLLAILSRTGADTVNVGSGVPVTLLEFARAVARVAGRDAGDVRVGGAEPTVRPLFVPDVSHARSRYGLAAWTGLDVAIAESLRAG